MEFDNRKKNLTGYTKIQNKVGVSKIKGWQLRLRERNFATIISM